MKHSMLFSVYVLLLSAILVTNATAFDRDSVLRNIADARKTPVPPGRQRTLSAEDTLADQIARAKKEEKAAFGLLSTCEGRFGALRRTFERQVSRAEMISATGGVLGVIGTVATCPGCAAFASGLAGLANPLQQTFRANADTPQNTQFMLNKLSDKISQELEAYRGLPAAIPGEEDFEANLRKRLDSLFIASASCAFYSTSMEGAFGDGATPPPKPE